MKRPVKIMIVDDEAASGNILRLLIDKNISHPKEIVCFENPEQALSMLDSYQPDLLMLDIEMPAMNGFDFLSQAGRENFDVIFTTAFDKYAIKAIRFSALDYLLKPVDVDELQQAFERYFSKKEVKGPEQEMLVNNLLSNLKKEDTSAFKLALSTMEGVFFFNPAEIIRCEGENNYTTFYFRDRKPLMVSKTIREYEDILTDYSFIRVHKSHLINKKYISQFNREGFISMKDGSRIPVSRRKKDEVMKELIRKG